MVWSSLYLNDLKLDGDLRYVDIDAIVDHHCLNFLSSQCCVLCGEAKLPTTTFIVFGLPLHHRCGFVDNYICLSLSMVFQIVIVLMSMLVGSSISHSKTQSKFKSWGTIICGFFC